MSLRPVEIFYAGRHIDYSGLVVPVSREDLRKSVSHFNTSGQKLPLVMRHPQTNASAFGYATKLAINKAGRVICAAYDGLSDGAATIINSLGAKVSAKIRLPGNPSNTSQGIEFDHVGFFPKGEKVSLDKLNTAMFSGQKVSYIRVHGMDEEELLAAQEKLKADMAAFAAQTAQFAAEKEVLPIVADLVAKGAITPADQAGITDVFTKLAMVPSDSFSAQFAAPKGGGNAAVSFLAAAIGKKAIPYGKDPAGEDEEIPEEKSPQVGLFMAPKSGMMGSGLMVSKSSMALDEKAQAIMKSDNCSYGEAIAKIEKMGDK